MKKFTFGVFIWFLAQIILLSSALAVNGLQDAKDLASDKIKSIKEAQDQRCDVMHSSVFGADILGLLFPITATNLVDGDWCWNK